MHYLPLILPYLISFSVFSTCVWMIAAGKINSAVRGMVIAIPALASCYWVIRIKNEIIPLNQKLDFTFIRETLLNRMFWIVYFASISIVLLYNSRPWYYFFSIAISYLLVTLQILSRNPDHKTILIKIFLLTLNFAYSVTLNYDLYFGTTDLMPHTFMALITYISGRIIPFSLNDYAYFPLYHIWIAEAANMLNLSVKTSLFLITAPMFAMTSIFLYYVFLKVCGNPQTALLSCLLYSSSSVFLYYSVNVITRTMAFIGFVIILYLIYSNSYIKHKAIFTLISIYMAIFLALIHQVSLIQIMVIFLIISISEVISENKRYLKLDYVLLFGIIFISYWLLVAYSFFKYQIGVRLELKNLDSVSIMHSAEVVKHEWLNTLGLMDRSICMFFMLIAILYILKNYKNNYASVFGLVALFSFVLYAPNPLDSIWQLVILYQMDRILLFVSPFIAFAMGLGVYLFLIKVPVESDYLKRFSFAVIIVLLFIFTFISLVYSISDSEDIWITPVHEYFISTEVNGFNFVDHKVPFGSSIHSDHPTSRYFPAKFDKSTALHVPYFNSMKIDHVDNIAIYSGYILIRDREFSKRGLYFGSEDPESRTEPNYSYYNTIENRNKLYSYLNATNKIYSNSDVSLYYNN